MATTTEADFLRLAMILENQGQTTLEKYLCKLAEFILFDSSKSFMSSTELSQAIDSRFQLQFDILEIENAIKNKGKGRILLSNHNYSLDPKVIHYLSTMSNPIDQLRLFVKSFIANQSCDVTEEYLLQLILNFLYYSFNSNVENFTNIIGSALTAVAPTHKSVTNSARFNPSQEDISLINAFISWDNNDKNKLFYTIVACSYEYCMITTKKNIVTSKKIFNGKRFYLDTNIIFRMAGINKDERRVVIKSFIEKCNEVGIKLYYTNEVLDELYRVIDGQVNYIKSITQGQAPVDVNVLESLNDAYDNNDFYSIYCSWCKEPQNKYHDYISFRDYLIKLINDTISSFNIVNIPNYQNSREATTFIALMSGLKDFKDVRRPSQRPSEASLRADVNNLMYVDSLKPKQSESLWQINDYIVSADQIFANWSRTQYAGVPIVMIPSIWLSIILKISGRTTNDDYKSYCLFMSLRQHRTPDDEISINPVFLLKTLAGKTVEKEIKEKIIIEIKTNTSEYTFSTEEDYSTSVDKAFDKILAEEKSLQKSELIKAADEQAKNFELEREDYEKKLSGRKTEDEYARKVAESKAARKTIKYKENDNVRLIFLGVLIVIALAVVASLVFDIPVLHDLLTGTGKLTSSLWTAVTWVFTVLTGSISTYFTAAWKYMGSDERKSKLYKMYYKQQLDALKEGG